MNRSTTITNCPEETRALAENLLANLPGGAIIALHGELGAGKTCFVKGLAAALNVHQPITSPTYTIANEYSGRLKLYHIDFYRINNADEALALGFDDYLESEAVCAIEWPERVEDLLPATTIRVNLEPGNGADQRRITITLPGDIDQKER